MDRRIECTVNSRGVSLHRTTGPPPQGPGPLPMADRIQICTVHKINLPSVSTLSRPGPDSGLRTLDSAPRYTVLEGQDSRLKAEGPSTRQGKTGHLQNHTGGEHRLLLPFCCCFCCCRCSLLLGLGTWWSSKCSSPSHPMYCQGTRLRGAARTVQRGYDGPLPHGIRGYLGPLCATF